MAVLVACSPQPDRSSAGPGTPTGNAPQPATEVRSVESPAPTPATRTATTAFTPVPLSTSGPSPTPILYTVKSGDTLVGIAYRLGTSVESLQILNPEADPRALQPGQVLIIPPPGATPGRPTPSPVPVSISTLACYDTPAHSLWCLGEATNSLDQPITNVVVQVTLLGADGQPAATQHALPALDVLRPGENAPLGALFIGPPTEAKGVVALVLAAAPAGDWADRYPPITVSGTSGKQTDSGYTVAGTVSNPGPSEISAVTIVVTAYDSAGLVTGYRAVPLAATLSPGGLQPFEVTLLPAGPAITSFAVAAQGKLP